MPVNIHTPERLSGETQQQYRERRAASKAIARQTIGHGLNGGISSRRQLRDEMRRSGTMGKRTRAYAALMTHFASKRITKVKRTDPHGSYTFTGRNPRRMWLAGFSAQRGY